VISRRFTLSSSHQARVARRPRERAGVAATELAVCMPVIVLIVLASIEACTMIFLQQSLSVAAYEGARVGLSPGAEAGDVTSQCQQILDDREVKGATIAVTPANIPGAAEGTWIAVETTAPFAKNSLVGGWLFGDRTLTADVQMMKER
jgi:Flp pilus assembly protein TadG